MKDDEEIRSMILGGFGENAELEHVHKIDTARIADRVMFWGYFLEYHFFKQLLQTRWRHPRQPQVFERWKGIDQDKWSIQVVSGHLST